jgi:hypothetical protein
MAPPEALINNSYSSQTHLLAGVGCPYPQSSSAPETTSKNWFFLLHGLAVIGFVTSMVATMKKMGL